MLKHALASDCDRVANISRKSTEKVNKRRKRLRAIKKGYEDKEKEEEGADSYAPGSY